MSVSPIKYVDRTYTTILNDINSDTDLADKPEWFKRMIAGVGDMISMINNATANQAYLRTAFTRRSVSDLLELIDYFIEAQSTSLGYLIFHLDADSVTFPVTYNASVMKAKSEGTIVISSKPFEARSGETVSAVTDVFAPAAVTVGTDIITVTTDFKYTGHKVRFTTVTTLPAPLAIDTDYYIIYISATEIQLATTVVKAFAGTPIDLTTQGVGNHTAHLFSFAKLCYQQETKAEAEVGTSDGLTEWQEFNLGDKLVLEATLSVRVGATAYTLVETLVDSTSTSKHYRWIPKSDTQSAIYFGNGTYGIVPASASVYATYSVGGGADSNITKFNKIIVYSGGESEITSVTNPTTFTGGSDEEGLTTAKRLAPLLLKARDRFVTVADGEALIENFGGVAYAKINKNEYGILTVQALGIANGGGNPSGSLKTSIETYLEARTSLQEIDVTFDDTTLTTVIVTSATKVLSGYTYADIDDYILLAWKLFFTETGKEITEYYADNTVNNTITLLNTIFSTSFTYDNDNIAITKLLDFFTIIGYRQYGDVVQESDAFTLIQGGVSGIDYLTITLPAFPLTLADDELFTHTGSTFNLTEI